MSDQAQDIIAMLPLLGELAPQAKHNFLVEQARLLAQAKKCKERVQRSGASPRQIEESRRRLRKLVQQRDLAWEYALVCLRNAQRSAGEPRQYLCIRPKEERSLKRVSRGARKGTTLRKRSIAQTAID